MAKIHTDSKFQQNFWKWSSSQKLVAKLLAALVREKAHNEDVFSKGFKILPQKTFQLQNRNENPFQNPTLHLSTIYN